MIFLNLPTSTHSPVLGSLNLPVPFSAVLTSFSCFSTEAEDAGTSTSTSSPRGHM